MGTVFFADKDNDVLTVGQITDLIKEQLSQSFRSIKVKGEISNCHQSQNGHVYFSLKDAEALLSAVIFRGSLNRSSIKPANGMQVVVSGNLDVYAPRGNYQIIADKIESFGRGALLEELEQRKNQLESEGLFRQERKKALPICPRRVAVVTSPTGAAIQDILTVLARRAAAPLVTILPTAVQGEGAAQIISDQIKRADRYNLGDVIIVARGGGSLEDLMPFNDEAVVRSIAGCSTPVVCGVGHETDVTLADLAADIRAATPSAASELISDRSEDILLRARGFRQSALDIIHRRLLEYRSRFDKCNGQQISFHAISRIQELIHRNDDAATQLQTIMTNRLSEAKTNLALANRSLVESSPQAVLERGYARVEHMGKSVRMASQLEIDDQIDIVFAKDRVKARVTNG